MKPYLSYPDNYNEELAIEYNNGCGPAGWKGRLVPDSIYGISIKEPCKIHDYEYEVGTTLGDFNSANWRFYQNLLVTCQEKSKWWNSWLNPLRELRCLTYYKVVESSGMEHFKDKDHAPKH